MAESKKILWIGDLHADDRTPSSRSDDYMLAILDKLGEIIKIAIKRKIDAIVFVGDIFNRMEVGGRCRNAIIAALMPLQGKIPCYVVIGNHDVKSALINIPNSAMGTLIESGVVIYTDQAEDLGIRFGHYKPGIEDDLRNGIYEREECFVWAFHANISVTPMVFDHILFNEVKLNSSCKLVVGGHLHREMTDEHNDVLFINPGSVCRNEMSEYHLTHMPGVLYTEYVPYETILKTEIIKLKSALSADEVFRIEEVQAEKDNKIDMQQYMKQISRLSAWSIGGDKSVSLRQSGQLKKIDTDVIELAVKTVEEVNANK